MGLTENESDMLQLVIENGLRYSTVQTGQLFLACCSEAMAARDPVLSQSPEFKEARIRAYDNATAIYDLLTIALIRWGHADLLHEVCNSVTGL
jgi:hypothetical protein